MTNMMLGAEPHELCEKHLRSTHGEIHNEIGFLESDKVHINNTIGHVKLGQFDTTIIKERHEELEDEAGYDSPLEFEDRWGFDLDMYVQPFPYKKVNRVRLAADDCNCLESES